MSSTPNNSAEDHYYAGIDLFGEGKLAEAIAEYTRALELDPQFSDALAMAWRKPTTLNRILTARLKPRSASSRSILKTSSPGPQFHAPTSAKAWSPKPKKPATKRASSAGSNNCGSKKLVPVNLR